MVRFPLVRFGWVWCILVIISLVMYGLVRFEFGWVRLEMARLGFILVWVGLFWFYFFTCLKKMAGKIPAGKNSSGKDLAGKRSSWEKT